MQIGNICLVFAINLPSIYLNGEYCRLNRHNQRLFTAKVSSVTRPISELVLPIYINM